MVCGHMKLSIVNKFIVIKNKFRNIIFVKVLYYNFQIKNMYYMFN